MTKPPGIISQQPPEPPGEDPEVQVAQAFAEVKRQQAEYLPKVLMWNMTTDPGFHFKSMGFMWMQIDPGLFGGYHPEGCVSASEWYQANT
jgi:hypothetical protein